MKNRIWSMKIYSFSCIKNCHRIDIENNQLILANYANIFLALKYPHACSPRLPTLSSLSFQPSQM